MTNASSMPSVSVTGSEALNASHAKPGLAFPGSGLPGRRHRASHAKRRWRHFGRALFWQPERFASAIGYRLFPNPNSPTPPTPFEKMDLITRTFKTPGEYRLAIFSGCEKYRYLLQIIWDAEKRPMQVIGLNPSTATEVKDDPTVCRCKDFARQWGHGGLLMTNLFAFRATRPENMMIAADPEGPDNLTSILGASHHSSLVLAAWGNDGLFKNQSTKIRSAIKGMFCLKLTSLGEPHHPLYLPRNLKPFLLPICDLQSAICNSNPLQP